MRWSTVRSAGLCVAVGLGMARSISGCNVPVDHLSSGAGGAGSPGPETAVPVGFPTGGGSGGGGSSGCSNTLPQPAFGMCTASTPPPPISGGTLLLTKNGVIVIISDPDRDAVYVVDISKGQLLFTIALQAGDEPGRLAEDAAGLIHVALRSGGALVTLDPTTGDVLARRSVCPAPRGVAYDPGRDLVWVACATGELVGLPAAGGPATTNWTVERDLRDIFVSGGALTVSEFRSAQVLNLNNDGTIGARNQVPAPDPGFAPHVLWRMLPGPGGSAVCINQEHSQSSINTTQPGGYGGGGGCTGLTEISPPASSSSGSGLIGNPGNFFTDAGLDDDGGFTGLTSLPIPASSDAGSQGLMNAVITNIGSDGSILFNRTILGVLPVDIAISPDGQSYAIATPGSAYTQSAASVLTSDAQTPLPFNDFTQVPIAVAFDLLGDVLVQTRDPANLWVFPQTPAGGGPTSNPWSIPLSGVSRCDTGHDIFHTHAGVPIACASCHPEGGDDGHVWVLNGDQRRTPSLRGTIAGTAPYHWPGDEPDLPTLVNDVYTIRMAGAALEAEAMSALTGWVQTIPPPPAPTWVNASAAAAGQKIFENSTVGCSSCHSGAKFTNNQTVDVGTGGAFQVPPLVGVGWRTPLLHDGCAQTIADRFGTCSTSGHGSLSSLSAGDLQNLEAYLETL
jgi:mono/diheme cytochrome c family protein